MVTAKKISAAPVPANATVKTPISRTRAQAKSVPTPLVVDALPSKDRKIRMVRDSFTIPKLEFVVLDVLKIRAGKLGSPVKKTELIRAGIKALAAMSDAAFLAAVRDVPSLKTGRPAKEN